MLIAPTCDLQPRMNEVLRVRARQLFGAVEDVRDPQLLQGLEVLGVFSCADADVWSHQRRTTPDSQVDCKVLSFLFYFQRLVVVAELVSKSVSDYFVTPPRLSQHPQAWRIPSILQVSRR